MFKRYLAFILLTILVLTSFVIPTYADSTIGEIGTEEMEPIENDRVPLKDSYTEEEIQSILSGDHNFDIPEEGIKFSAENFPLEVDENVVSPDWAYIEEDDYYITVLETGKILWSPNASYVTTTSYYESEVHMWVFDEVDTFTYTIRNKFDPSRCLAVSQTSTGVYTVVTKTYSATDTTCHWSMSITSDGNYIQSEAVGTNADGQYLYLSGKRFLLNSTKRTYIGLVDVDWFVPCTSLTFKETYYSTYISGKTQALSIGGGTPTGANCLGNHYITYTVSDTSVCTLNSSKQLVGVSIGYTTIRATHKMTGATGTVRVHVGYPTKVKIYYDYAFKTLCEGSTKFDNIPGAQIEEWFAVVQKKYAEYLDIHLILVSTTLYRSLPEKLVNGNMICSAGNTLQNVCNCSGTCVNSGFSDSDTIVTQQYHHKNIYNILYDAPRPNTDQNINLIITGHSVCAGTSYDSETSTCAGDTVVGLTNMATGRAVVAANSFAGQTLEHEKIIKTIAHELGHLFAPDLDHYGDSAPNTDYDKLQTENCIYGENRNTSQVLDGLALCIYCHDMITYYADRYDHR